MDTILLAVTGLSLAMAAGMAVLLGRTLRAERRRSDARVALLEQLAADPWATAQHGLPAEAMAKADSSSLHASSPAPRPDPVGLGDFDLRPSQPSATVEQDIFHEHEAPSAWPRRVAVAGGMAAVLAAVVFGWSASRPDVIPATQGVERAVEQPLELVTLQHTQEDGALVITGLVQNPRNGTALSRIVATVLLFGADGQMLTSGRAPLDFTTLSPGDESPFVIRVPVAAAVTRYRVGFRGEKDRVLGHVDRRAPDALARKQAP